MQPLSWAYGADGMDKAIAHVRNQVKVGSLEPDEFFDQSTPAHLLGFVDTFREQLSSTQIERLSTLANKFRAAKN